MAVARRQLELAFVFKGEPFAWRCSFCHKLFSPPGPEVSKDAIAEINRNFQVHVCYPLLDLEVGSDYDSEPVPNSWKLGHGR